MRNANLRIRCISDEALEAILEMLKEESNGIFIESWETKEAPRTGTPAEVVYGASDAPRSGLGARTGRNSRDTPGTRSRSRAGVRAARQ